jgi:hypothetical protein
LGKPWLQKGMERTSGMSLQVNMVHAI